METECDKLLISQKDYGTDSDVASVRAASNGPLSASGSESEERYSTYPMSDLISSQEHFTKDEITRQVKKAKVLSVLTLLATSTITVLSFISSKDSDSSAAYGFAFDSFLAGVTSSIVLWRFWSVKQLEHHDRKREFTALFIITISLLITGALIAYEAIDALAHTEKHKKSTMLLVLSSVSRYAVRYWHLASPSQAQRANLRTRPGFSTPPSRLEWPYFRSCMEFTL